MAKSRKNKKKRKVRNELVVGAFLRSGAGPMKDKREKRRNKKNEINDVWE